MPVTADTVFSLALVVVGAIIMANASGFAAAGAGILFIGLGLANYMAGKTGFGLRRAVPFHSIEQ